MPITDEQKRGLRALIAKYPDQKERILKRAETEGATDEDLSGISVPEPTSQGMPQAFRAGVKSVLKGIDEETDAMAEGIMSGATWGMLDAAEMRRKYGGGPSDPYTVDLPFFGKTSPTRAAGTVMGAALSPLALPVAGVTGLLASRVAPVVGKVGAQMAGSAVTGASLESIRQLAFEDEMDPANITKTAAFFLAGDMAAKYAPAVAARVAAWKKTIPEARMKLVERFKDLPEVQAEAINIQKTDPFFNPEYQAILKAKKLAQDLQSPSRQISDFVSGSRVTEAPETALTGTRATIEKVINPPYPLLPPPTTRVMEAPETALAGTGATMEKMISPKIPLLPTRTPETLAKGMGETPSQIAAFEKEAAKKTKSAIADKAFSERQMFERRVDLEYYKNDVRFIKNIREAVKRGEKIYPEVLDEYKNALGRMAGNPPLSATIRPIETPPARFPTEGMSVPFPTTGSFEVPGGLPGLHPFPTENLNLSAVRKKAVAKKKTAEKKAKAKSKPKKG